MFTYEVVYCDEREGTEKVINEFQSEHDDLTTYDDRTLVSCGSCEYIRLKD